MSQKTQPALLLVGVPRRSHWSTVNCFYTTATLHESVATFRLIDFDLLVVGLENKGIDIWDFLHRVLGAWPQQRWILASEQVTTDDEVLARSLGALMVLNSLPDDEWLIDFATSLRRPDVPRSIPPVPISSPRFSSPETALVRSETN